MDSVTCAKLVSAGSRTLQCQISRSTPSSRLCWKQLPDPWNESETAYSFVRDVQISSVAEPAVSAHMSVTSNAVGLHRVECIAFKGLSGILTLTCFRHHSNMLQVCRLVPHTIQTA